MLNLRKSVLALSLGAVLASSIAGAQTSETRLDVNLKDADILTATKMVTQKTGLQFMFKSQKAFSKVTLQLKDQTADDVIRYICDAANAYVKRDDNGVYIISDQPMVAAAPVATAAAPVRIFRRMKLLHSGADEIYARVVLNSILDPMAKHAENIRAINMAKQILAPGNPITSKSAGVFDSLTSINQFSPSTAQPVQAPAGDGGGGVTLPGESAAQRPGGGGGIGGGGGLGGQNGGGGGLGGGQNGGGGGGLGGGQNTQLQPGQGLIPSTITHIQFDPTDNSLIVQGSSEDDINYLQNLIAQFDVRPKQVQIKVEFITTTENLDQSLGYHTSFSRGTVVAGIAAQDFIRASDPVFLTYSSGDAVFRLRTRLAQGNGRVVTAPIVRTMNNTPATVFAFTTDWVLTSTTQAVGNNLVTTVTPQQLVLGTGLSVTPRINNDSTITMGLTPTVSSVAGSRTVNTSGNTSTELPIFTSQSVSVVINLKNKETVVLGGLNTESSNSTLNRVPVLSDIPIFGQFFRRTIKQKTASELLIFVTATIIEDEEGGINP